MNTSTINLFTIVTYDDEDEEHFDEESNGIEDIDSVCKVVTKDHNTSSDDVCAVCMEAVGDINECDRMITLCKHFFCKECISAWLSKHKTCPLCMTDLEMLLKN